MVEISKASAPGLVGRPRFSTMRLAPRPLSPVEQVEPRRRSWRRARSRNLDHSLLSCLTGIVRADRFISPPHEPWDSLV
jgi:hypothetical protein